MRKAKHNFNKMLVVFPVHKNWFNIQKERLCLDMTKMLGMDRDIKHQHKQNNLYNIMYMKSNGAICSIC